MEKNDQKYEIKANLDILLKNDSHMDWQDRLRIISKNEIKYEASDILVDLFSNLTSDSDKGFFVAMLSYKQDGSPLVFYTLLRLGFYDDAIESFYANVNYSVVHLLHTILRIKLHNFTKAEIVRLTEAIEDSHFHEIHRDLAEEVITMLLAGGVDQIRREISKVNIEINRDKEEAIKIIKFLNFDDKYNQFLTELDEYINTNSEIVTSGMIGNFRQCMQDILNDIAKRIASTLNETIPNETGGFGDVRKYLRIKLEYTEKDDALINKFVDILHSEGGHAFTSNTEYLRLTRNIGIEILLFILTRYQSLFENAPHA